MNPYEEKGEKKGVSQQILTESGCVFEARERKRSKSGRQDSNLRPLGTEPSALQSQSWRAVFAVDAVLPNAAVRNTLLS